MASHSRRLGALRIDVLSDGIFDVPLDMVSGTKARPDQLAHWRDGVFPIGVNAFLLRSDGSTALVDAGTGPSWGPRLGHVFSAMQDLGVAPGDVDRVYLTHLHGDHALGLLDGDAPSLPRAEVIVPAADLAFFTDPAAQAKLPVERHGAFEIAARIAEAYQGRLRPVPFGPIAAGLELVPLPGHTPGQGGYLLTSGDEALMLWGDALHFAGIQAADPEFGLLYDLDPATAVATRRSILARAAAEGWIVGGGHVPGFGRVLAEGDGFRIVSP